jgi:hypothetical protein
MFKSFGKVFVVSLLVVAMTAPLAFGTTARVRTLAHSGDYLNDDSNVFRWYATLPSYSNLVMAEVGTYAFYEAFHQALGITHACGDDGKYGTFGVFLMHNVTDDGFFMTSPVGFQDLPLPFNMPDNKFAIQWGKEFEGLALGLGFTRSDDGVSNSFQSSISFTTFGGGIRTDLGDNAYADLALTIGFAGGENIVDQSGAPDTADFDKKNVFDVAARIFYEWQDYATLVPLFDFQMVEFALENPSYLGHGDKATAFRFGVLMNMDVNTNNMIIFGVEFQRVKWEPSLPDTSDGSISEVTATYLPTFRLALESDVKSWLTARVGAKKELIKETFQYVGSEDETYTFSDFDWFLGVGFHIAEFDIDCELGPEAPFSLGYWMTGHTAYPNSGYPFATTGAAQPGFGEGPITRISATYHF